MNRKFDDKLIGIQAAGRLTASLRARTRTFSNHYNRNIDSKKLSDAKALPRFKNYGLLRNNTRSTYLRAISIVMEPHGYIMHYGVNINRNAGSRTRGKPKHTTYHFKNHYMKQTAKPFLDSVIQRSGVVAFISQKIAESRGEEIAQNLAVSISNF